MRFKGSASHNLRRRNPEARPKAASSSPSLSAAASLVSSAIENQTRAREPSRDSSTKLTRVPSRRGSVTSQSMIEFSSSRNSCSIRRPRMPPTRTASSRDLRCLPMANASRQRRSTSPERARTRASFGRAAPRENTQRPQIYSRLSDRRRGQQCGPSRHASQTEAAITEMITRYAFTSGAWFGISIISFPGAVTPPAKEYVTDRASAVKRGPVKKGTQSPLNARVIATPGARRSARARGASASFRVPLWAKWKPPTDAVARSDRSAHAHV